MKTNELLDAAKSKLKINSDYALAKALGVPKTRIGNYRTGIRTPDDETCFQLAEVLEADPSAIIAAVRLEGEKEPIKREFWRRQSARYALGSGVIAALLAGSVQANVSVSDLSSLTDYVLYEIRKAWARVKRIVSYPVLGDAWTLSAYRQAG